MPYQYVPSDEEDETKTSKYNTGAFISARINELCKIVEMCKINPTAFNEQFGVWNYQVIISSLDSLYFIVKPKLNEKERELADMKRDCIKKYLKSHPIFEIRVRQTFPHRSEPILNEAHWLVHQKKLEEYETLIKDYHEKHGFGSPEQDESALF